MLRECGFVTDCELVGIFKHFLARASSSLLYMVCLPVVKCQGVVGSDCHHLF
jgi:hypothetical protein